MPRQQLREGEKREVLDSRSKWTSEGEPLSVYTFLEACSMNKLT